MKKLTLILFLLLLASSSLILSNCKPDDEPDPEPTFANLLLVHANFVDEMNPYNVAIVGASANINENPINFMQTDVQYRKVESGEKEYAIIKGIDTIHKEVFNLEADKYYTLYIGGNTLSEKLYLHEQTFFDDPTTNRARIYFVNMGSGSPAMVLQGFYLPLGMGWVRADTIFTQPEFDGQMAGAFKFRESIGYNVIDVTTMTNPPDRLLSSTAFRTIQDRSDTTIAVVGGAGGFGLREAGKNKTVSYVFINQGGATFDKFAIEHDALR